jgi:hypothetical protein
MKIPLQRVRKCQKSSRSHQTLALFAKTLRYLEIPRNTRRKKFRRRLTCNTCHSPAPLHSPSPAKTNLRKSKIKICQAIFVKASDGGPANDWCYTLHSADCVASPLRPFIAINNYIGNINCGDEVRHKVRMCPDL